MARRWWQVVFGLVLLVGARSAGVFFPGQPMLDTAGQVIDAHGAGMLHDGGRYWWYGSARKDHTDPECVPGKGVTPTRPCDKGINLYSSDDLYAWRYEGLVVKALTNGSFLGENGLDLERPKVIPIPGGRGLHSLCNPSACTRQTLSTHALRQ